MANSESFYGSLNITELLEQLQKKHSSFSKADNGKIYMNVTVWLNEEKDKYGNSMSIQANTKEGNTQESKFYLGNCKKTVRKENKPLSASDTNVDSYTSGFDNPANVSSSHLDPKDDLPF